MEITIQLDDTLHRRAKRLARQRRQTVSSLMEEGLGLVLERSGAQPPTRRRVILPVPKSGGGTHKGIDLSNSAALLDRMEGRGVGPARR